jgi:DNA-binding IclR family transcriptional regulator
MPVSTPSQNSFISMSKATGSTSVKERRPSPRAAARIVHVLRLLADLREGANLSKLCELTSTPKTSLLTLLRALTESGYVKNVQGTYTLGLEAFKLASAVVAHRRFPEVAQSTIEALAAASGETVLIAHFTQDRQHIVYIAKADSPKEVRFMVSVGDRRPLYSSSAGRLLLANMDRVEQDAYVKTVRIDPASKLVTSKSMLKDLLAKVIESGLDTADLGSANDVYGIAAPILESSGEVLAALVVGGPNARMLADIQNITDLLVQSANEISELLGRRGLDA